MVLLKGEEEEHRLCRSEKNARTVLARKGNRADVSFGNKSGSFIGRRKG